MATIRDVARLANVSVTTVSNVINSPDKVSAELLARVQAAIDKLGIDVFAIVEQDMYPCEVDAPLPIAQRTRSYLGSCGVPSVRFN